MEESVKKLRLRVVAGPSEVVCGRLTVADPCTLCVHLPKNLCRILRYDIELGKCYSGLMTSPPKLSLDMLREEPVK